MQDGRERKIVYLTSMVHGLVHMQMLIFAAVNLKMAAEFGVSITAIGFVGVASYFMFGFGALPAGFFIDRIGARRVVAICLAGMGIANVMIAFAPSELMAMAGLGLLGLSGSLYHPAGLGLISRNVKKTGHALGIHGLIGTFGESLGPIVAGIIAASLGWRLAFLWPAVPMAIMSLTYFLIRFGDVGEDNKHLEPEPDRRFAPGFLRLMLLVILLQGISGFIYRASTTFMPAYFGASLSGLMGGMDPTAAGGILTGVILAIASVGQYISGRASGRWRPELLQVLVMSASAPLLLMIGLAAGIPLLLAAVLFAFSFYAFQPLGNVLVAKFSPPGFRGRSYGLSFFLNFGLGSFGAGFAGFVGETQGFANVYLWLAALCCVSILLAALVLFATRRHEKNNHSEEALLK